MRRRRLKPLPKMNWPGDEAYFRCRHKRFMCVERSFEDIRGSGAVNRVEMAFIRIISVFDHSGSIQASVRSEALIICWNGNSTSGSNYLRFRMINYFSPDYHHLNLNRLSENCSRVPFILSSPSRIESKEFSHTSADWLTGWNEGMLGVTMEKFR